MSMHYVRFILKGGCKVLTDCGYESAIEGVLAESEQQTCLPDPTVSDEQQLEEIIVRFRHLTKPHTPNVSTVKGRTEPESPQSGNPQLPVADK